MLVGAKVSKVVFFELLPHGIIALRNHDVPDAQQQTVVPANDIAGSLAVECKQYAVDKKWTDANNCADRLAQHDAKTAKALKAQYKQELENDLTLGHISESVNKGRHTTVGAFLHPLPDTEGAVVDTPGLREIGLWELPINALDDCFPELREVRPGCRFADCAHVGEPGCAVRRAVEALTS